MSKKLVVDDPHDAERCRFAGMTLREYRVCRGYGAWQASKIKQRERAKSVVETEERLRRTRGSGAAKPTREDYLRSEIGQKILRKSREKLVDLLVEVQSNASALLEIPPEPLEEARDRIRRSLYPDDLGAG